MEKLIARNNIQIHGEGENIIFFVHGYGCDQSMWRYITPSFSDNFKLVLIDLVGSGKSDLGAYQYDKYSTLDGYADDIIEICEAFNFNAVNFVGHSVSAMIGTLASIKRPSLFNSLVLIGPSPCYINDDNYIGGFNKEDIDSLLETLDSNYLGWSSTMAPVIMGNPDRPELAEELEHSFCQNNPEIAKHFARITFSGDNREDLKKLQTKALVIQSGEDAIAAVEVGKYVHENIEDSEFVILDTVGHCPHLSAPEETTNALHNFFNKIVLN